MRSRRSSSILCPASPYTVKSLSNITTASIPTFLALFCKKKLSLPRDTSRRSSVVSTGEASSAMRRALLLCVSRWTSRKLSAVLSDNVTTFPTLPPNHPLSPIVITTIAVMAMKRVGAPAINTEKPTKRRNKRLLDIDFCCERQTPTMRKINTAPKHNCIARQAQNSCVARSRWSEGSKPKRNSYSAQDNTRTVAIANPQLIPRATGHRVVPNSELTLCRKFDCHCVDCEVTEPSANSSWRLPNCCMETVWSDMGIPITTRLTHCGYAGAL